MSILLKSIVFIFLPGVLGFLLSLLLSRRKISGEREELQDLRERLMRAQRLLSFGSHGSMQRENGSPSVSQKEDEKAPRTESRSALDPSQPRVTDRKQRFATTYAYVGVLIISLILSLVFLAHSVGKGRLVFLVNQKLELFWDKWKARYPGGADPSNAEPSIESIGGKRLTEAAGGVKERRDVDLSEERAAASDSELEVEIRFCRDIITTRQKTGIRYELVDESARFDKRVGKIKCFTRITGAAEETSIVHEWIWEGNVLGSVPLAVKSKIWRAFSEFTIRAHQTGTWRVNVTTRDNRLIAGKNFVVQ